MENRVEEQELSQEEMQMRKEEMLQFFNESLPYLKAQLAHEELLMKIDECRFKRVQYQVQYAMLMNPSREGDETPEELHEELKKEGRRPLKKN